MDVPRSKPWQHKKLRFPKKAVIVVDDNKSQSSMHAGKIIQYFGCQAASAASEGELIKLLLQAKAEQCEIAAIISDESIPDSTGMEIYDGLRHGQFSSYMSGLDHVPFLLVTGKEDVLAAVPEYHGGERFTSLKAMPKKAWKVFEKTPLRSRIGEFIGQSLGMAIPIVENPKEVITAEALEEINRIVKSGDRYAREGSEYPQNETEYLRELQRQDPALNGGDNIVAGVNITALGWQANEKKTDKSK